MIGRFRRRRRGDASCGRPAARCRRPPDRDPRSPLRRARRPPAMRPCDPAVGECYDLTDAASRSARSPAPRRRRRGYWADADPVPCSEPHTFEVTESGAVPMDVNAFEFAAEQCGDLDVWNAVRVNASGRRHHRGPAAHRAALVRRPTVPATYVCGAVPCRSSTAATRCRWCRSHPASSGWPTASARCAAATALGRRGTSALRRRRGDGAVLARRPRWQVRSWVMWSAFYDDFPGTDGAAASARPQLCGVDDVVSVPTAARSGGTGCRVPGATTCIRNVRNVEVYPQD